jgi:hypothetical protein
MKDVSTLEEKKNTFPKYSENAQYSEKAEL